MAKVITLSKTYPDYHPAHPDKTFFAEKFNNWYWDQENNPYHNYLSLLEDLNGDKFGIDDLQRFNDNLNPEETDRKGHTIRAGKRFKKKDMASIRTWSGAPYRTPQITLAPDVTVRTWNLVIKSLTVWELEGKRLNFNHVHELANNDGLTWQDFMHWFPNPGEFQIICWDTKIDYDQWLK